MTMEGSLLEEALHRESGLENSLVVDVYLVGDNTEPVFSSSAVVTPEYLLSLAQLGSQLNDYVQRLEYPWLCGGDGPVFGVYVAHNENNRAIPCLRAVCHYGVAVADEWMLIGQLMEFSSNHTKIAVECWDRDDGQVILIQGAEELPDWVDQIGPKNCRHRCWICKGDIQLIAPSPEQLTQSPADFSGPDQSGILDISLLSALHLLEVKSPQVETHRRVSDVVGATIQRVRDTSKHYHRAALAVPRSVASLLHRRPDLLGAACWAFVESSSDQAPRGKDQPPPLAGTCEDWVWTSHAFAKIHYAMLRTFVAAPDWKTPDSVPARYNSIEVKRLKRQCTVQSTPHLRHGIQLGVRVVAGIDLLLQETPLQSTQEPIHSFIERRVTSGWGQVARESGCVGEDWVMQAWSAGPNDALYSLDPLIGCPVYEREVANTCTALSHPEDSLSAQVRKELLRKHSSPESSYDIPPGPNDVDSDEWMTMPDENELKRMTDNAHLKDLATKPRKLQEGTSGIDVMASGVKSFLAGESGIEGVVGTGDVARGETLNPTIFLNILHKTLRARAPEDLDFLKEKSDPFFRDEDYDLMEPNDVDEGDEQDSSVLELMQAMDEELGPGRKLDRPEGIPEDIPEHNEVVETSHVLSNLLMSVESSAGTSGPVQNMLKELGVSPPDLEE